MNQILSDGGGGRNKNKQLIRAKSLINIQGIFHMGMTHWEVLLLKQIGPGAHSSSSSGFK